MKKIFNLLFVFFVGFLLVSCSDFTIKPKVEVEEIEEVIVEEPVIEEPIIEAPVVENPVVAPIENKADETPVVEVPVENTNETEIKENNAPAAAPVVEETEIEVPVEMAVIA